MGEDKIPVVRDKSGKFVKGQSGNPKGMKPIPDVVKAMFKAATPDAIRLLVDTMNNVDEKSELRVECASKILDRVYGKASQPIEIDAAKSLFNVNIQVIEQNDKEPAITIDV